MTTNSERPILHYHWRGLPFSRGYTIDIYATGRIMVTSPRTLPEETQIPPSEVTQLVTALLSLGFLTLQDEYKDWTVMDGWTDTLTLHHLDHRKTVTCTNRTPSPQYAAFIQTLKHLIPATRARFG